MSGVKIICVCALVVTQALARLKAQMLSVEAELEEVFAKHKDGEMGLRRQLKIARDVGLTPEISLVMWKVVHHLEAPLQQVFKTQRGKYEALRQVIKRAIDAGLSTSISPLMRHIFKHLETLKLRKVRLLSVSSCTQ